MIRCSENKEHREHREDRKNCLITGVGGQGTLLLSRLIGNAALEQGLVVRGTETIGMAQRGGSVVSHIRMGNSI
ncbi:MAG: 2-oxoacid:acceptor oxidoreductase family protein, partial [Treponema sp.]|nr:2-oxoacid:acceptor oxidoreductase family protein [Treponema sp.]